LKGVGASVGRVDARCGVEERSPSTFLSAAGVASSV